MRVYSIGVDLGGTNLRIAAVDSGRQAAGEADHRHRSPAWSRLVIGEMCDAIQSLNVKFRDSGQLAGIGIGVPGFIDMDTGTVMDSPNLPDWTNFPVRELIEGKLGATGHSGERRQLGRHGRKMAGCGPRRGPHGDVHARHGRWRRIGIQRASLARHERHGRRTRPHQRRTGRTSLRLRQPRLPGAVRVGDRDRAHGARGDCQRSSRRTWLEGARGNVEFTSRVIYQLAMQGACVGAEDLPYGGPRVGHRHRRHGQRAEPAHVRHRRRCGQRMGGVRAHHVCRS